MVFLVLVPVALLALAMTAGGVAGMILQTSTTVTDPTKTIYRVAAGPTGIPWMGFMNWDGSWLTSPYFWIRYLRKGPRSWSVVVMDAHSGQDALRQTYSSRQEALQVRDALAVAVADGGLSTAKG